MPDGFGSTDAEMTELMMLPAIRPVIEPPFCARGSSNAESGEMTWFVIVGGVEPKKTPLPDVNGLDEGKIDIGEQALLVTGLDVGVLDVAADDEVLDRPAHRDRRIRGVAVGLQRLDRQGVDRHIVHAEAELRRCASPTGRSA